MGKASRGCGMAYTLYSTFRSRHSCGRGVQVRLNLLRNHKQGASRSARNLDRKGISERNLLQALEAARSARVPSIQVGAEGDQVAIGAQTA